MSRPLPESQAGARAEGFRDTLGTAPPGGVPAHAPGTTGDAGMRADAMARLAARYWRRNLALIAVLMAAGFAVSFIGPFWARELSAIRVFGWPLPFYLGAQGAILVYLLLVILYAVVQRRNDAWFRRASAALRS